MSAGLNLIIFRSFVQKKKTVIQLGSKIPQLAQLSLTRTAKKPSDGAERHMSVPIQLGMFSSGLLMQWHIVS